MFSVDCGVTIFFPNSFFSHTIIHRYTDNCSILLKCGKGAQLINSTNEVDTHHALLDEDELSYAYKSPESLIKTQSDSVGPGWGLAFSISNKL